MAITTPTVEQLTQRPGTITTYSATANIPEIKFFDTDIETSYTFTREDRNQVGFALTHTTQVKSDLHLAVLEPVNFDPIEDIHLTYAEARLLRLFLTRPEVARILDTAE